MAEYEARNNEVVSGEGSKVEPSQDIPRGNFSGPAHGGIAERQSAGKPPDFATVAAKLAAHAGATIPAELSGNLALEIVLNEIVEQARLATGASGAAIALGTGDEMVCRATSGNAPELGTRLNTTEGLSGACVRSRQIQCCDDSLTDPRADAEISRQIGVRSVAVYPVLDGDSLIGILEVFSSRVAAFGDRDLRTLEALAGSIVKSRHDRDASLASGQNDPPVLGEARAEEDATASKIVDAQDSFAHESGVSGEKELRHNPIVQRAPTNRFDWFAALSGAAILCLAVMMGVVFGARSGWLKSGAPESFRADRPRSSSASSVLPTRAPPSVEIGSNSPALSPTPAEKSAGTTINKQNAGGEKRSGIGDAAIPVGSLVVYDGDREIFRAGPSHSNNLGSDEANVTPAPDSAASTVEQRVQPQYPESARLERVQGPVLVSVLADRDGMVQAVKVLSGDPRLADAAIAALKQWKFKPHFVNGHSVPSETKITVQFTLP